MPTELGPDVCYACQELIGLIQDAPLSIKDFATQGEQILHAQATEIISVAQECNWIFFDKLARIHLTPVGSEIAQHIAKGRRHLALRGQIYSMIRTYEWAWADSIRYGREEALKRMPEDAQQCFEESRMLSKRWTKELISWWDRLGQDRRVRIQERNGEVGRAAEELSYRFETARTGTRPIWRALESAFYGFDLLSRVSKNNTDLLRIEVKGTKLKASQASFTLTRHEWDTARRTGGYVFHLWTLEQPTRVAVVDYSLLEQHVPRDQGRGKWTNSNIPFGVFFSGRSDVELIEH
jgi:hypothetical protein